MGDNSAIEWTDATWNPVTGCTKVSPGCKHCYAETVALRFWPTQYPPISETVTEHDSAGYPVQVPSPRPRQFTDVQCHEDRLDQPLRWKRGRRIFVNSMSDLFHEDVLDAFIDRVFAVMALAPQHTFQVLTKRAERMREYLNDPYRKMEVARHIHARVGDEAARSVVAEWGWPLRNVWLGVSVESPPYLSRLDALMRTPAAVRFASLEPLLADLGDLTPWLGEVMPAGHPLRGLEFCPRCGSGPRQTADTHECPDCGRRWSGPRLLDMVGDETVAKLDWVIVGSESGPGARPMDEAWVRSLRDQCSAAGVSFFYKQKTVNGRKVGLPMLDGRTWSELPTQRR